MNYAKIRKYDTSNWDGVNTTLFVSGCDFGCPGCFNKEAQDFNYGNEWTREVEDRFISYAKNKHCIGVCILGGEVFQQDPNIIQHLLIRLEREVSKPIHVWTGYTWEDILKDPKKEQLLSYIDTLIDGRFVLSKKDLRLKYRGSSNQRVIDVQKSLRKGKVVEIQEV